jgi:hypothetical protein
MAATVASYSFNPVEAAKYGVDFVDLFLTEWGDRSVLTDGVFVNTSYALNPGFAPAAITIHPYSAIDRCLIQCSYPGDVYANNSLAGIRKNTVPVSVDQPFIATAPSLTQYPLRVFSEPTAEYNTVYRQYAASGTSPFNSFDNFFAPWLGLRLWRKSPGGIATPRLDAEYLSGSLYAFVGAVNSMPGAYDLTTTEALLAIIPIHGRRSIRLRLGGPSDPVLATFKVTSIVGDFGGTAIENKVLGSWQVQRYCHQVVNIGEPRADFIAIYGVASSGAPRCNLRAMVSDTPIGAGIF